MVNALKIFQRNQLLMRRTTYSGISNYAKLSVGYRLILIVPLRNFIPETHQLKTYRFLDLTIKPFL